MIKEFDPTLIPLLMLLCAVIIYVTGRSIINYWFQQKSNYNRRFFDGTDKTTGNSGSNDGQD